MTRRLLAVLFASAALSAAAQTTTTARYIVGTRAAGKAAAARMLQTDEAVRVHAVRAFDSVPAFAASLTPDEAAALRSSPGVRYVQPVVERHLADVPSAPRPIRPIATSSPFELAQTVPYGIDLVHARAVWPVTKGKPVHVVVFDTGIDVTHPDLKRAYAGGYNTYDQSALPVDDNQHGTHVAGIIAAADNHVGVVGVAPDVDLWAIKVLDKYGYGADENVIAGIDFTLQKKKELGGNWIVNFSFTSDTISDAEAEAIGKLITAGVLPVAASGNVGFAQVEYPAAYPGVVAVGAIDSNSVRADFSSYGAQLALVAPGVDVYSCVLVGTVPAGSASLVNGITFPGGTLVGAKRDQVTAPLINCGLANPEDIPAEVRGRIALIERGGITFSEKVRNLVVAGAVGVVIYNVDDTSPFTTWTLIRPDCTPDGCAPFTDDVTFNWPVVVALDNTDGLKLLAPAASSVTITIAGWDGDYGTLSGTSMSAPHVCGAAALAWASAPSATAVDVHNALILTARDIEAPGADQHTGWGVVDAAAAAKFLNPIAFGVPPLPPAPPHGHVAHP
jgi:subtilisin family serine protease